MVTMEELMRANAPIWMTQLTKKTIMLIWDTVASFGLTPFWSDFIDYVKCKLPVRDVTKMHGGYSV
jgi:hypothetical protein